MSAAFPRGKGGDDDAEAASGATSRKRKGASSKENDFLFGSRKPSGKEGASEGDSGRDRAEKRRKPATRSDPAAAGAGGVGSAQTSEIGSGMVVRGGKGRPSRLELVSFKKLSKGVLLLGVVSRIRREEIIVSLPSGLSGVVRRSEVSDLHHAQHVRRAARRAEALMRGGLTEHAHAGAATDDGDGGGDASGSEHTAPLCELVSTGQVVRCCIVALSKGADGRRVDLSLRASLINRSTHIDQLKPGAGVYGSVVSAEDHGYVISLGIEGTTAFLHRRDHKGVTGISGGGKDAPATLWPLVPGQPIEVVVKSFNSAARTAMLSTDPAAVTTTTVGSGDLTLRQVKPGMLVSGIVSGVLSNGLLVSFLGFFVGGIDHNHMDVISGDEPAAAVGAAASEVPQTWKGAHAIGDRVTARVLLVDYPNKAVRLTLRPHLVAMHGPVGLPPVGSVVDGAVVLRVDPKLGLFLALPPASSSSAVPMDDDDSDSDGDGDGDADAEGGDDDSDDEDAGESKAEPRGALAKKRRFAGGKDLAAIGSASGGKGSKGEVTAAAGAAWVTATAASSWLPVPAYVHISHMSDTRTVYAERTVKAGDSVRCRVVGHTLLEGWAAASLKPSVLAARILRPSDVEVGAILPGTIAEMQRDAAGVVVKLGDGVTAVCTTMHLADTAKRGSARERLKPGTGVTARVLYVNPKTRRIFVTLRKSLVRDKMPPITSYGPGANAGATAAGDAGGAHKGGKAGRGETASSSGGDDGGAAAAGVPAARGTVGTGFVTKVGPFGLVVTFYNNVHGLVPAKMLVRQGVEDVAADYELGQVVRCVVVKCDPVAMPPRLLLSPDVAGAAAVA
ncbi:unnamed protein product, partial [Phaeothamnion confervicola]